jgi:hypothetical protein
LQPSTSPADPPADRRRAAVDAGVRVAFFSGNAVCAAIGPRPSVSGQPDRVFSHVGYFGELAARSNSVQEGNASDDIAGQTPVIEGGQSAW